MNPSYRNPRSKKIILGMLIFLMILLIATAVLCTYYAKNRKSEDSKKEFLANLQNFDVSFFLNQDVHEAIAKKIKNQSYEISSQIKLATTMENNMFSGLDLSKIEIQYQGMKDKQNKKFKSKIASQYAQNDLLTLDVLVGEDEFALKSDEIVNRYVGMKKMSTNQVLEKAFKTNIDLSIAKKMKNFLWEREPIDLQNVVDSADLKTYVQILEKGNFSKKENVLVTLDEEPVSTTEYAVELDTNQVAELWNLLEKPNGILAQLVVDQVKNFDTEGQGILEYKDNDNITQISGEENYFNTSAPLNIWGQNTANETTVLNQVPAQVPIPENTIIENQVQNQTVSNETVENESSNTTQQNTVEEPVQIPAHSETEQNQVEPQPVQTEENLEPNQVQEPENEVQNQNNMVIEEDENLRIQGFIQVNEEDDEIESDGENNFIIGKDFEETIKNMIAFLEQIDWKNYLLTGAKANCTQEELAGFVEEKWGQLPTCMVMKMYVAENQVVKMKWEVPETSQTLDMEIISKSENEKYLNLKLLKEQEEKTNGYTVSFYKKMGSSVTKSKINVYKIQKNKIHQKLQIYLETNGMVNSKKYTNIFEMLYADSDGEFKLELENSLNFDIQPEIEELNEENCLWLDVLSEEQLVQTAEEIKKKTKEVLQKKNEALNMINMNQNDLLIEPSETQDQENEEKQKVKEILIQTISNKMGEYLANGENLELQDLADLQIPNYEVEVSITSNLAIITVNGYPFKLDGEFHLSDS